LSPFPFHYSQHSTVPDTPPDVPSSSSSVTTQDFIKFWGKIFVFILLVLIENSQGFETF
jgi:hypothetical protein